MTSRGAEKMNNDTIGVDVSKDHLDAHRLADGATRRFANDKGGHKALIKWLAQTPLNRVVFEPTGPYHRAVERALGASGVPFVKVNPRQARRFAEATGKLAKTDRLDAAILARMGALLELEARPARSELLFELKELYVAREALVKDRTAAKNRGKALTLSLLKRQNAQRLEQIDRQIATVEAAILQIIEANVSSRRSLRHPDQHSRRIQHHRLCLADRNAGARLPRSRPGRQPRRPGADRPTVRALDRSLIHSRRSRRRPPSALHARPRRRTLQPGHEGQYAHLIETGKPAKVALTAIMRKLVVLANALLKANRPWTPKIACLAVGTGPVGEEQGVFSGESGKRIAECALNVGDKLAVASRNPVQKCKEQWTLAAGRNRRNLGHVRFGAVRAHIGRSQVNDAGRRV